MKCLTTKKNCRQTKFYAKLFGAARRKHKLLVAGWDTRDLRSNERRKDSVLKYKCAHSPIAQTGSVCALYVPMHWKLKGITRSPWNTTAAGALSSAPTTPLNATTPAGGGGSEFAGESCAEEKVGSDCRTEALASVLNAGEGSCGDIEACVCEGWCPRCTDCCLFCRGVDAECGVLETEKESLGDTLSGCAC
jgi:hypothetical protein